MMQSKQLSLQHRVQFPNSAQIENSSARYPAILALHGRGSNEEDLLGLAPHLPAGLLWVSPRAPLPLGPGSYEWYRVKVVGRPDPAQVFSAIDTIDRFIREILGVYPIDPEKLFLLGFSQGSLLSMCYALTHPARIAGVVAHSGYIPNGMELEIDEAGVKNKPFLLTHGEHDTMIPIEWGRASRDRLQELGADITYREFQLGHQVSMDSLEVIFTWLQQLSK